MIINDARKLIMAKSRKGGNRMPTSSSPNQTPRIIKKGRTSGGIVRQYSPR